MLCGARITMAPIPSSDDESVASDSSVSGPDAGRPVANGFADFEDEEEEFHTDDSDASEPDVDVGAGEESDLDAEATTNAPSIPLLPEHLLKSASQPAPTPATLPWAQLTRQQKKARRNNSRKMKKRTYDRFAAEANRTGTLEAGRVAQVKRGVVPVGKKVRSGRVEKKKGRESGKTRVSGRQRLVEHRRREAGIPGRSGRGGEKTGGKR